MSKEGQILRGEAWSKKLKILEVLDEVKDTKKEMQWIRGQKEIASNIKVYEESLKKENTKESKKEEEKREKEEKEKLKNSKRN